MFVIWIRNTAGETGKVECSTLAAAHVVWDALAGAGFNMVSARP